MRLRFLAGIVQLLPRKLPHTSSCALSLLAKPAGEVLKGEPSACRAVALAREAGPAHTFLGSPANQSWGNSLGSMATDLPLMPRLPPAGLK